MQAQPPESAARHDSRVWRTTYPELGPVVVSRARIARRVGALSRRIVRLYKGTELTIVAVLTGSLIFLSDLLRRLPLRVNVELAAVRSYPGSARRSQGPRLWLAPSGDLGGRHVLIVDDILDSGQTLEALARLVAAQHPRSLRTCVLLRKARKDLPNRPSADLVGFDVGDRFVVGYGLDCDNLYRNLPDVRVLGAADGSSDAPAEGGREEPA